ncbi:MAG: uroporphyrinogen-III synthase [Sulfurimonas sp.]
MSKPIYLFSISSHPDAKSVNSLSITFFKPHIDFSQYDYLIITSKQSSKALAQYKKEEYLDKKALCVSVASAKSYEDLGAVVLGTGAGYGDNLIDKIKTYPKNTKWLYLRAKTIASNFVKVCQDDGFNIDEAIVYESDCSQKILNVKVEDNAILIFTSPSSLNCFLKTHTISKSSTIIVIGKTTAKAVPNNREYILSEKTSIQSCIDLAKNHY